MQIKENDIVEVHFPSSSEFAHWNGLVAQVIAEPKTQIRGGDTDEFYPLIRVLKPSTHPSLTHYPRNITGSEFRWRYPRFFRAHREVYFSPFEKKYV